MNNIIGLKPSQPFTLCEPITVDLRIAATVPEFRVFPVVETRPKTPKNLLEAIFVTR